MVAASKDGVENSLTAMIFPALFLHYSAFPMSKNSYLVYSLFHLHFSGLYTNQFNNQLPVVLVAHLVRALHQYCRSQGSSPGKAEFFAGLLVALQWVTSLTAVIVFAFISVIASQ